MQKRITRSIGNVLSSRAFISFDDACLRTSDKRDRRTEKNRNLFIASASERLDFYF